MDNSQLGIVATAIATAIIGSVTAIGRAFRWAVKYAVDRLTKAKDDSTAALVAATASDRVVSAKLDENTAALRQLTERIDDRLIAAKLDENTAALRQLVDRIGDLLRVREEERWPRDAETVARVRSAAAIVRGGG